MSTLRPTVAACAAGALLGLLGTISPMIVLFGLAMIALFAWAGHGLGRRERVWVFGLLGTGVALRLLVLAVFFFATLEADGSFPLTVTAWPPTLIPDEWVMFYRANVLRIGALGVPIDRDFIYLSIYADTALNYVHAYLELFVGESPYSIRLFDVTLYSIACVALYRMVRPAFGALASLGGLAVVLFQPSLFVWSISFLKETPLQFLVAVSLAATVAAFRTRKLVTRVLACAVIGATLLGIGAIRNGFEIILAGGVGLGVLGAVSMRRPKLLAVALIVCLAGGAAALWSGSVQQRATDLLLVAVQTHVGYVYTSGWNFKLLDPEFYLRMDNGTQFAIDPSRLTFDATARYVIRAVTSFLFVPLPWQVMSLSALIYLPEQIIWNLLVLLAIVGVVAGLRLDASVTMALAGSIIVAVVLIGMISGNVGTLVRHRSIVAVLLPWLSSLGACETLLWMARWRTSMKPDAFWREQRVHVAD